MKRKLSLVNVIALLTIATVSSARPATAATAATEILDDKTRAVDLVVCLDTSGSMDGLIDAARVEVRQLQELSLLCKCAIGDEGMRVGVEVGGVRAERLDRDDQARHRVVAIEDRADARDDRVAGRAES